MYNNTLEKIISVLCLLLIFVGCKRTETFEPESDPPLLNREGIREEVSYGEGQGKKLDITYICKDSADQPRYPVIYFIHGGGWNAGDKNMWTPTIAQTFIANRALSVSVNYLLAPNPINLENPDIAYPENIEDVSAGLQWVIKHIGRYGGDSTRIFLVGHSAGAHLAALLATDRRFLKESLLKHIRGVILLDGAGYLDLNVPFFTNIREDTEEAIYARDTYLAYQNAFGTPGKPSFLEANPCKHLIIKQYSPPYLLLHGSSPYRLNPNISLQAHLSACGIHSERYQINELHHMGFLSTIGTADNRVKSYIVKFIRSYK